MNKKKVSKEEMKVILAENTENEVLNQNGVEAQEFLAQKENNNTSRSYVHLLGLKKTKQSLEAKNVESSKMQEFINMGFTNIKELDY